VPPEQVKRKLAAILAAGIAGYSRLMGALALSGATYGGHFRPRRASL